MKSAIILEIIKTQVIRRIIKIGLAVITVGFALLTIERTILNYNDNEVYFDGVATYDTDAVVAYGFITGTLFLITIGLILIWKRRPDH